ncbi:MAG: ABC transporter permease [Leucobacter sp.]
MTNTLTTTSSAPARGPLRALNFPVSAWIGVAIILVITLAAILAPWLGLPDPTDQEASARMSPIGTPGHILGADQSGRDVLSRLVFGARVELLTAFGATAFAAVAGVTVGLVAGFLTGAPRSLLMRGMDVILTVPSLILALFAVTLYGAGVVTLIAAIGITLIPSFARVTYAQVLVVREAEFVEADVLYGRSNLSIMFGAILPNVAAPIIVQFTLNIATAILLESGLSFIGLGIVPPDPSWGSMVAEGQRYMATNPSLILVPAVAVVVVILAFSLAGDGLRQALDPRSRKRAS